MRIPASSLSLGLGLLVGCATPVPPSPAEARTPAGAASCAYDSCDQALSNAEAVYADLNDAVSVLGAIDAGSIVTYRGKDRAAWANEKQRLEQRLATMVRSAQPGAHPANERRVLGILQTKLAAFREDTSAAGESQARCADANRREASFQALSAALVACFTEIGNSLEFEASRLDRASALAKLHELEGAARRRELFESFAPLWQAVNGTNGPESPYRRLIALAARDARTNGKGSPIDAAARTVGITGERLEQWLVEILEAWRIATQGSPVEPWDYRYAAGAADRALAGKISLDSMLEVDHRYYRDLGVDLDALGVLYDLAPRAGKSSVAYTDFLVHGRMTSPARWSPTVARVLATYRDGSLGSLNELVHENGHAAHISAIRNRPVFVDWNDDLFVEAFADVSSWSLYEPAWQRRYLDAEAPERDSLRALFGGVMLDVAWALFESRMLREPATDPNALWTQITSRYLHIAPHPELSWWAVRVQLVDMPGYMVNYGLGAVLTADLRQRVRESIGPFDTGNARWYPWLSQQLLRFGSERDTPALVSGFLGRPVSPEALLAQIRRIKARG